LDERKSTSNYVFSFGTAFTSWKSKLQDETIQSSAKVECCATNKATKKANWYKTILWEIGFPCEKPLTIFCDNHTDIKITKNPIIHARTKHLEGNCHYIRD
jgi:hypothetical protein